jgi:hypothetical protein
MTGEDVREVFETILPQQDIERLCVQCGVIERQRQLHLGMLVRAMSLRPEHRAEPTRPIFCGRIWNLRSPG